MNSFYILIEENHPLKNLIIKKKFPRGPSPSSAPLDHILVDLRIMSFKDRLEDLQDFPGKIIADGTTGFNRQTFLQNKNLVALTPLSFFSPTKTYEALYKEESATLLRDFFSQLELNFFTVASNLNYSFVLPRVGAMAINEYLYASEENLANSNDMDLSMRWGVNYPLGPSEWSERSSLEALALLLNFLSAEKKDSERYQLSPLLNKEII